MNLPEEERRDWILQRSPFSATYLNTEFQIQAPLLWQKELRIHQEGVATRIINQVGADWEQKYVNPQYLRGENLQIFNPNLDAITNQALVRGHMLFGYEIGNREDSRLLLPDFVYNMVWDDSVNPLLYKLRSNRIPISNELFLYIEDLLMEGVSLAKLPSDHRRAVDENNTVEAFVAGLDLDGI